MYGSSTQAMMQAAELKKLKEDNAKLLNTKAQLEDIWKQRPEFASIVDPKTGKVRSEFALSGQGDVVADMLADDLQTKLDGIQLDKRGLDAFRNEALRTGGVPSIWAKTQLDKAKLNRTIAQETGQKSANREAAAGLSRLAMRGGAGGGSRLSLVRNAANASMKAAAEAKRQEVLDSLGIESQDETNRIGMLSQLPGMEIAALQPELQKTQMWSTMASGDRDAKLRTDLENRQYTTDINKFNLNNALTDRTAKNQYSLDAWKNKSNIWASNREAEATEKAGDAGCYITTAVCEAQGLPDDCRELTILRAFRDGYMAETPERAALVKTYYDTAPRIVEKIKALPEADMVLREIRDGFISPCIRFIEQGKSDECFNLYRDMVSSLQKRFLD